MCKKCSRSIDNKTDLFTVCEGDCGCSFHASCASLTENEITVLSTNFIWLCDECLHRFQIARDCRSRNSEDGIGHDSSPVATVLSEVNEKAIQHEVSELRNTVTGILKTLAKFDLTGCSSDLPRLHSTPISPSSSFVLQDGTNTSSFVHNAECPDQQNAITNEGQFSLLLTNVDSSVSESDIQRLVHQALGFDTIHPESIDVVKLVSKWKSCRTMDYISFRVVLDNRWRLKALNSVTWPKGIRFREFVVKRFVPWKPVL